MWEKNELINDVISDKDNGVEVARCTVCGNTIPLKVGCAFAMFDYAINCCDKPNYRRETITKPVIQEYQYVELVEKIKPEQVIINRIHLRVSRWDALRLFLGKPLRLSQTDTIPKVIDQCMVKIDIVSFIDIGCD